MSDIPDDLPEWLKKLMKQKGVEVKVVRITAQKLHKQTLSSEPNQYTKDIEMMLEGIENRINDVYGELT